MSYMWNRLGGTRCDMCNQKIKVGELVMHRSDGMHVHDECPEDRSPMSKAFETMTLWTTHKPVPIKTLVIAAQAIIDEFGDKK